MKKTKLMVSEGKIKQINENKRSSGFLRYKSMADVFGRKNFYVLSIGEVKKEKESGESAKNYFFNPNFDLVLSDERGVSSGLFLASGFNSSQDTLPQRRYLEDVLSYLDFKRKNNDIIFLINSKKSTLYEDKISFVEFYDQGFNVPRTLHFADNQSFNAFINENGSNWIVKHRFGYDGKCNFLINKQNYDSFKDLNINDFVVQEELPILEEVRMIFFGEELLGSRLITDRTRPWETRELANRKHIIEKYSPSHEEINGALSFFNYVDATIGAVDTVHLKGGGTKILEFNGVGTGFGYPDSPAYDLNQTVAEKLKKDYIQNG
ncbi:MAG: hypothetical protein ACFFG0_13930 [Candidatus Thorarchaeota archaeon]